MHAQESGTTPQPHRRWGWSNCVRMRPIPPPSPTSVHLGDGTSRFSEGSLTAERPPSAVSGYEHHLNRLKAARALALQTNGGFAAATARSKAERRSVVCMVDLHANKERERRQSQIVSVYSKAMGMQAGNGNHRSSTAPSMAASSRFPNKHKAALAHPPSTMLELSDELLGEGATGKVWAARFGPTRMSVAAKVVHKASLNAEQLGWIREEIAIHKALRHPHICTLHGALEDRQAITMVLSLCRGGSLCDTMGRALATKTPLTEEKVRSAFTQLCGALHYCHRSGVVHRDIKLDNLCWTDGSERVLVLV